LLHSVSLTFYNCLILNRLTCPEIGLHNKSVTDEQK
jgi:hypothetical protein